MTNSKPLPFIDIHTHHPKHNHISITSLYELQIPPKITSKHQYFSVGLHPNHLNYNSWKEAKELLNQASLWPKVMAFGECGLDRRQGAHYSRQIEFFEKQLLYFKSSSFNICFIHCVRAWSDVLPRIIPKDNSLSNKIFILHDFNSSLHEFEKIEKNKNIYFSLGQNYLRSNTRLHHFIDRIPLNKIFFESDESGQSIEMLYQRYLEDTNPTLNIEQLKSIIYRNYQNLFISL